VRFICKPRLYKNLFQDEVFSSGIDSRRLDLDLGEMNKVKAYIALTKPRVIELLLITTVPTMILAQQGIPSLWLVLATLIGGALSAGSANAFNCYIDADIDKIMGRTKGRPLVTGDLTKREALIFSWVIGVASILWLGIFTNWLAASLSLAARVRLHLVAQASHPAEHRLGWRGRCHAGCHRLGRGYWPSRPSRLDSLLGDLPLDPAALLAAIDAIQGRLCKRRSSNASGG
jgi:hypothetical protein